MPLRLTTRTYCAIAAGVLVTAAVLRVRAYESVGYWLDELYALRISGAGSFFEVLRAVPETDDNPPLYYLLLSVWREVAGSGELETRGLTLAFSWAAVVSLILARRYLGDQVALGAALLMAVLPAALFPIEARPYGLMIFFSSLLVICWVALFSGAATNSRAALIVWGALVFLSSFTHYFGALFVVALAITGLILGRRAEGAIGVGGLIVGRRAFVAATLLGLVPVFAWVVYTSNTLFERSGGSHWLQAPAPSMILDFFGWVVGGTFLSALLLGAGVAGAIAVVLRWREVSLSKWLMLGLGASVLMVLLAAQLISFWTPIWLDKYGVVLVPAIAVFASYLIWFAIAPRLGWFAGITVGVAALLLTSSVSPRPIIPNEGWRDTGSLALNPEGKLGQIYATTEREAALYQAYFDASSGGSGDHVPSVDAFVFDSIGEEKFAVLYSPYGVMNDSYLQRLRAFSCVQESPLSDSGFGLLTCR